MSAPGHGLVVDEVSVSFGHRAVLDRVSLQVDGGRIVAVLGPSGSGKSTLLRVVAGLVRPSRGSVRVDGTDVTRTPTHKRGVGMVFQNNQLFHISMSRATSATDCASPARRRLPEPIA